MSPQRWQQLQDLYHSARENGDAVLADADPDLRRVVEKLLAQDSESGEKLLDQQAADLIRSTVLSPGTRLGPYKIEALLGEGGMGHVFRATDTRLGRSVALKVAQEKFSDRFEREARVVAALSHPNICTLHDVGSNYLVMEFVEGESPQGPLAVEEVVRI